MQKAHARGETTAGLGAQVAHSVTRDDYFRAGLEILSTTGYGQFKLAPLCALLKVTTGSFYNHFVGWRDFKLLFLQAWLETQTTRLVEVARSESDPLRRLELLTEFAAGLPHGAESAIRAWSHTDTDVRQIQKLVDDRRHGVVHAAMSELISDDSDAATRYANLGTFILVGYQQLAPPRDIDYLRWSLRQLIASVANRSDK